MCRICDYFAAALGLKGILNVLGIYKVKGQHMKILPTKHDIPQAKYDVPLPFNKVNSTGQYIMSCNTLFSPQDKPLTDRIHP